MAYKFVYKTDCKTAFSGEQAECPRCHGDNTDVVRVHRIENCNDWMSDYMNVTRIAVEYSCECGCHFIETCEVIGRADMDTIR